MKLDLIRSADDLAALVQKVGFLPFFRCGIPGFSIAECTPRELWFADGVDGPWEWKGPVARTRECAYGKIFGGKTGYVSREWLPDLVNFRRDGYDFDSRYEEGLAPHGDKAVYDAVAEAPILSTELKRQSGYGKGGQKGFDPVITRLQMQMYVTAADFVYPADKNGNPHGWGVAQYATPEMLFGEEFIRSAYARDPAESRARILAHLARLCPEATEKQLGKIVG